MTIGSNPLKKHIEEAIMRQGCMSFADFMKLALYHPTLGYYMKEGFTIGRDGDFTTAPQISHLFAYAYFP